MGFFRVCVYIYCSSGTRVLVFPGGPVPYNKVVRSYCEKAKPLMQGLMEHANMVSVTLHLKLLFSQVLPRCQTPSKH